MRRKDKAVESREEIVGIIEKAIVCRLGLCRDNVPYVVPLSFGYRDGCLYLHCAREGKKIDMIRANPRVCFEIDIDAEIVQAEQPCNWGMRYASVIGLGTACVLEGPEEKISGLDVIMAHYSSRPSGSYPESFLKHTAVIQVRIEEMTGKKSGS